MEYAKEQSLSNLQKELNINPNDVSYLEISKLHVQIEQIKSSKCKVMDQNTIEVRY